MAIESVMFYGDSKLAGEQSAEADWQRRGLYIGPQFSELDEVWNGWFGYWHSNSHVFLTHIRTCKCCLAAILRNVVSMLVLPLSCLTMLNTRNKRNMSTGSKRSRALFPLKKNPITCIIDKTLSLSFILYGLVCYIGRLCLIYYSIVDIVHHDNSSILSIAV